MLPQACAFDRPEEDAQTRLPFGKQPICLCGGDCSLFVWLYQMSTEAKNKCAAIALAKRPVVRAKKEENETENVYRDAKSGMMSTEMLLHLSSRGVDTK